jgi:hypothetical protein
VMFSVTLSPLKPEKKTANPKGNISSQFALLKSFSSEVAPKLCRKTKMVDFNGP